MTVHILNFSFKRLSSYFRNELLDKINNSLGKFRYRLCGKNLRHESDLRDAGSVHEIITKNIILTKSNSSARMAGDSSSYAEGLKY